ncbi:ClbS/DfsB family four-helix bundle protein [Aliiroseovarius subalbicans]|uniref:ClbS/DfsB family four-helix bundle protein n=1 Tax=Aliiroseovarius subalbicans TaxID=2925840 RepID=UPI001F585C25|nr:ClbS/DfsB family four-helix bundle protein [Aliiroseovarius subalbicans]MCI2400697.1 ClbS/DfsB family four-helix bundle protein [Aliiroseovarius subalbicans]
MPAATVKADLIAVTEKEWAKLAKLMDSLDPDFACVKREEDTSIKDVIGHRAHWITLFLGWYADGKAGKTVHFPAEGYKWNDLKAFNADLRAKQSGMGWDDVRTMLAQSHARLIDFYATHDDAALYGGPMKGANNAWTPGRWSEAAGASHYRSAAKWIRACLRTAK